MSFPSPLIQKNGIHSSLTLGYTLKVKLEMYIHKYKLYWIDLHKYKRIIIKCFIWGI